MILGIASTGYDYATAAPLSSEGKVFNVDVQTVPAGSGVKMPRYMQSFAVSLIRNSGANDLKIYPALPNGTINGLTTPFTLTAGSLIEMWAFSPLDWVTMEGGGGPPSIVTQSS